MRKHFNWLLRVAIEGVIQHWGVTAFSAGVGAMIASIYAILAYDTGLSYHWLVLFTSLTFCAGSVGAYYISLVAIRLLANHRSALSIAKPKQPEAKPVQPPDSVTVTTEERLLSAQVGGASASELKALQVREKERAQPKPNPIIVCKRVHTTPVGSVLNLCC